MSFRGRGGGTIHSHAIPHYPRDALLMSHVPQDHARQGFARGLCVHGDDLLIGGSSPATVTAYTLGSPEPVKSVNITMDVRNAIHGLEIWPF